MFFLRKETAIVGEMTSREINDYLVQYATLNLDSITYENITWTRVSDYLEDAADFPHDNTEIDPSEVNKRTWLRENL